MFDAQSPAHPAPILAGEASDPSPPPEPARRTNARADILAVLSAAPQPLNLDAIHVEVNADASKPHLAKGPIEVELEALIAAGTATKTTAGEYAYMPPATELIGSSPEASRVVRATILTLIHAGITYPANPDDDILHSTTGLTADELAGGIVRANQPKGAVFPSGWVDAFAGCAGDASKVASAIGPHLEVLVVAGLLRRTELELPPETIEATPDDQALGEKIASIVGGDKDRFVRAATQWTVGERTLVDAWLALNPPQGSTDDLPFPVSAVLKIPTPPTDGGPGDGALATVYVLTTLGQERFVERGALALAAQSLPGWVEPTPEHIEQTVTGLVDAERRKLAAEMEAERRVLQNQLAMLKGDLASEQRVTASYEAWLKKHTKVPDPRKFFLQLTPPTDPAGHVEEIEEEFKIDDAELKRMIIEREDLRAALTRTVDDHKAKKKAMEGVEDALKEQIADLDASIARGARDGSATHMVKKRVVFVVEGKSVVMRSAMPHELGKEIRRSSLPIKAQIAIPGAEATGEPVWSPTASDPSPAPAAATTAPVVAPSPPPAEPRPPPPPTWTGSKDLNLATLRRVLVNDTGAADLGLFQTPLGKDGILREDLEAKLIAFFGGAPDPAMLNKALGAAITKGDLLEGKVLSAGEGGATLTKTILWHKDVATPPGVAVEGKPEPAKTKAAKKEGGSKADKKTAGGKANAGKTPATKSRR
jgi:hypothetical protein